MTTPVTAAGDDGPTIMSTLVFRDTRAWAEAIAALPAPGPLPARTVLVPRERVAHSLRRELLRAGHAPALAGTLFVPVFAAAAAVLAAGGVSFTPGEEALRPARLLVLFGDGRLPLRHFTLALLRGRPGWDHAFARAIGDLEETGLRPEDLDIIASGSSPGEATRLADVATVWRAADASADRSWTRERIYLEAAGLLERRPETWPFDGPTLATVTGRIDGAQARFAGAIPGSRPALLLGRPLREPFAGRVRARFGEAAAEALAAPITRPARGSERDILAAYLFAPPATLADPARPRSVGADGTVDLEEHAGVDAEIDATADWVARQILEGIPLEDIAVLVPAPDPLAPLVAERLARLPWPRGHLPVHVAGGVPFTSAAAGARTLAVVRALRRHLAGDALAEVLPALRTTSPEGRHLSHGAAMDLVWSLGTAGGNPARPEGALEWATRVTDRETELQAELARAQAAADDPEQGGLARRARDLERLLGDLRDVRPAVLALVDIGGLALAGATLAALWPALRDFLARWLLQPGEGARAQELLESRLAPLAASGAGASQAGDDALRAIEEVVAAARLPVGRFGDPAVYVGSLGGAVGLRFRAVRVIGLAEGHLPAVPREDPVLPDALRARLVSPADRGAVSPPTAADRALGALHALDQVIRDTTERIALSAPRLAVERSLREPSSVILEAAAALGRPNALTGERGAVIPDTAALTRDAFVPARTAAQDFRRRAPIGEASWQDGVAARSFGRPSAWGGSAVLDLERLGHLADLEAGPLDGILGAAATDIAVPGLDPAWPISPSALRPLLQCPYLFLLGNVLGLEEPAAAPPRGEIGQPFYGALLHRAAEEFYRVHGRDFGAREDSLEGWQVRAGDMIERVFDEFLRAYPLAGVVQGQQRNRLADDLRHLLEYDWAAGARRRFVAVERTFGRPVPVVLPAGHRVLHVRGQIDRLDVEDEVTLVRDLKTGRAHPRTGKERPPSPLLDVQLAVYGLVARELAPAWGLPRRVAAAYTFVGRGGAEERAWREDFDGVLVPAARQWLEVAGSLLAERAFPRTPDKEDCTYCRFRPVCGEDASERARHGLAGATGARAGFRVLKGIDAAP